MAKQLKVAGLDIGGVNIKAARLDRTHGMEDKIQTALRPLEIWRGPELLVQVLAELAVRLDLTGCDGLALTMTAELSDVFRTKRDGVRFVCRAVHEALPYLPLRALDLTSGHWVKIPKALEHPLDFAANNWLASAKFAARKHPDAILMDVGSTTTDIIPIRKGSVAARGRTDTERLTWGELIYSGILRTNPDTIVRSVPLRGQACRVAAERFAIMADVNLLLGNIEPSQYTCPTPDGRGRSPQESAERLARLICADSESLSWNETLQIAQYIHERQFEAMADGLGQVLSGLGETESLPLLASGSGAFMVHELGKRFGLTTMDFPGANEPEAATALPAVAAASLLAEQLEEQN